MSNIRSKRPHKNYARIQVYGFESVSSYQQLETRSIGDR
jgi:hypothetical protein